MAERITFCTRCSAAIPWGRVLCEWCLDAEVARHKLEGGKPDSTEAVTCECRSCYTQVDERALICPHCGQDPRADFWDAKHTREPRFAGPWIAAAYLLVILPMVAYLMFALF